MTARAIQIKNYITDLFAKEDDSLQAIRTISREKGLPEIEVPEAVGRLIYSLAKIQRPKRILEIGTLAGYSTLWLAKALREDGFLISLELNESNALIAKENIGLSGFFNKVEIRVGSADSLMDAMIEKGEEPFDLIFIDADKESYLSYLDRAIELSREGTLILSDNLIPKGEEIGAYHPSYTAGNSIYAFNEAIAAHPRLESTLVTTIVGNSGRIDALGLSIVV
jgi:predicted O-methyltransferase YrrM